MSVIAFVLLVLPVVDWLAAAILVRAAWRQPRIAALTERAITATILACGATLVALLAGARLLDRQLPPVLAIVLLVAAVFALSAPAMLWLWRFARTSFRDD